MFEQAEELGAEALQIFISAPQQWQPPKLTAEDVEVFKAGHAVNPIPVFFHGVYLVNLAAEDTTLGNRSTGSLKQYLRWAGDMGVLGTIFHVGSHKGAGFEGTVDRICERMGEALVYADNGTWLIMENNAGQGGGIGCSFSELGTLIRGMGGHERIKVCLDTCHAFAMGYDIASREGCEQAMEEFDREIGLDRLVAVHANDSKMPLGGVRDRHENIGDGHIGYEGFRTILSHPAFGGLPFILEVPGIDGGGPDKENVDRLKKIREEVGAPAP